MTTKRFNFSEIGGNTAQNDILPAGTLVVDDSNTLRLHDGNTQGGNAVGGSSGGSVLGTGSFSTLPDFLDYEPGTRIHAGQNSNGVFFSGDTGEDNVSYPIRTNFTIPTMTKVVVTLDVVVNTDQFDFGICVYPVDTQPVWNWGTNVTRISAQYNEGQPFIYGTENVNADSAYISSGTYQVKFTYEPEATNNERVKLETFDSEGTLVSTVTLNEYFGSNYRIGFGADLDNGYQRTYIKNLSIAIDGGPTYTDTLMSGGGSNLSPYVTINNDSKVEVSADIVFASASATSSGYIISTLDPDGNEDSYFEASAADSAGVMYTVGYYYGDNDYALVYATNTDGTSKWRISLDQINGENIRPTTVICKNDFLFVGFKYYDNDVGSNRVGVVRLNADDGTIDTRWLLTMPGNAYPSIRDVAINNNNEPIIVGQVENEMTVIENVTPLRGQDESNVDYLVVNTADILPSGETNVGNISWQVDTTGNGDWAGYADVNRFNDIPVVSVQGNGTGMRVDIWHSGGHPTSLNLRDPGTGYTNNGNGDYTFGEELKILGSSYGGVDGVNDLTLYVWTYNGGNNWTVVWPQQDGTQAGNTPTDKTYFNMTGGVDFRGVRNNNLFTAGSGFATNFTAGDISIVSDTAGGVWLKIDGSYPAITSLIEAGGSITVGGTTVGGGSWSSGILVNTTPSTIPNIGGTGYQLTYDPGLADGRTIDTINVTDAFYTGTWNFRYSLNGQAYIWTPNWYHTYGSGSSYEQFMSVAHDDNNGNIYVGGEFWQNSPQRSDAVYKLDSDGNTVWAKYVEDSDSAGGSSFGTVALDSTGDYLYVISQNNNGKSIVTKLNTSDATSVWSVRQTNEDGGNYWNNEPRGAVDGDGNVYLTGSWTWDDGQYGLTVHKLSGSDGSLMWANKLNTSDGQSIYEFYNDDTQPFKVTNGKIYYAGYTYDSNGNRNIGYALCVPDDGTGTGTYGRWKYEVDTTFGYESFSVITDDGVFGATDGTEIGTNGVISLSRTPDNFGNLINTTTSFAPSTGGNIEQVASITFADGSVQTTAAGGTVNWTNPNNNVWRIEEYNGGAAVYYDGGDYDAKWFDIANHTSGSGNFRGAIIQYHAYINDGNIIGTIHLGNDYTQQNATHTEHLSGDSDLQYASLWECNNERGQLYFKMTNGWGREMMVQWTAKVFYGSESNC
jgi:hypothetical protein